MWIVFEHFLLLFLLLSMLSPLSHGQKVTFYEDLNKDGRSLKLGNIRTCTTIPRSWHLKISSLDTHDNCFKFYDTPICKGRFLVFKTKDDAPSVISNLKRFNFDNMIKSVKPCKAQKVLPPGRYKIQNVADGMYLTARSFELDGWTIYKTQKWAKKGSQQWLVERNFDGSYHLTPRLPNDSNPLIYNLQEWDREGVAEMGVFGDREIWDLLNIEKNIYLIRNDDTNKCLFMEWHGHLGQAQCNRNSKYQQWTFREL